MAVESTMMLDMLRRLQEARAREQQPVAPVEMPAWAQRLDPEDFKGATREMLLKARGTANQAGKGDLQLAPSVAPLPRPKPQQAPEVRPEPSPAPTARAAAPRTISGGAGSDTLAGHGADRLDWAEGDAPGERNARARAAMARPASGRGLFGGNGPGLGYAIGGLGALLQEMGGQEGAAARFAQTYGEQHRQRAEANQTRQFAMQLGIPEEIAASAPIDLLGKMVGDQYNRLQTGTEYKYMETPEGIVQIDPHNGQTKLVHQSAPQPRAASLATLEMPDGTKRTFDLGIPEQRSAAAAAMSQGATEVRTPATQVNIGGEGKADGKLREELSKKQAEQWGVALAQGQKAAGLNQDLEVLGELLQQAPQGPVQGRALEILGAGFSSAGDAANSIIKRLAPQMRAEGSGSTSDIEYAGMLASFPRLAGTEEGNRIIADTMRAKNAIDIERAGVVNAYMNEEITAAQARQKMAELDQRSILSPELKAMINPEQEGLRGPNGWPIDDSTNEEVPPDQGLQNLRDFIARQPDNAERRAAAIQEYKKMYGFEPEL